MSDIKPHLFKVWLIIASFSLPLVTNAQSQDSVLKKNQLKAGIKFLGGGASYERKLNESLTLYSEASLNLAQVSVSYFYEPRVTSSGQYTFTEPTIKRGYGWVPMLTTEIRNYNVAQRIKKKKNMRNNSFSMLTVGAGYLFKGDYNLEDYVSSSALIGYSTWGIQRAVSKALSFEFYLGPGIKKNLKEKGADLYLHESLKLYYVIK